MPISISSNATIEKNKITSNNAWLILLSIQYQDGPIGYLCLNNETITWNSVQWLPALFSLGDVEESKEGDIPAVPLSIIDVNRVLIPYIDSYKGGIGANVNIYIVNSGYLENTVPEVSYEMEVIDVTIAADATITFSLGAENLMTVRCPKNRYLKNQCRFNFKDSRCGYTGVETECDRTLVRCYALNNDAHYGGFPGIGTMGVQV